jgi:GDP-L-fucose synthase
VPPQGPIYIAGHRGLVGSALLRALGARGVTDCVVRTRAELDLADRNATHRFFMESRPATVVLAAARVGGIRANDTYPADFIEQNLAIELNVIEAARAAGVDRLLFLGSSCIYPREAPQPIREDMIHTGPLEPTNRAYALAKLAGIEMCWSSNRQHGTRFLSVMPSNLYGPGDNYHPDNSHVIPGLIRRFHAARLSGDAEVSVWGTGTPRREFLYSDDMAEACLHLLELDDMRFTELCAGDRNDGAPPLVNIGVGVDVTIRELAERVAETVGYSGRLRFDTTKPDGTPRKLLDVSRLAALGWRASTRLEDGLRRAYADFLDHEARAAA